MLDRSGGAPALLILLCLFLAGCGGDDSIGPFGLDGECIHIEGEGRTVGHVRSLAGTGMFSFDGEEREAMVGVYLNDLQDIADDRKEVNIVYQFWWSNGDMILTENDVILSPLFEDGRYQFSTSLFVKSGMGMFEGLEGESILRFEAELFFAPHVPGEGLSAVEEHFSVGGAVCLG